MEAEKIRPEDAARMIFPIDVAGIRAELARMLKTPDCANFVKQLLDVVSKNAAPGNTLVAGGDILKIFDLIQTQKGMVRSGDTAGGAIPGANFALGSIATGNAQIQVGNFRPGLPVTAQELKTLYLKSDAQISMHETIHHAGRLVYSDQDLAIVVSMLPPLPRPPLPTTVDRFKFSQYWDAELKKHCK
ncbi:MAG: hypothetical protein QOJ76_2301 [Acidobacteriota bacterium]|jgi:hypothetical protein|nr:hypothetical protein [Acidobacteriota bacterium]